jgi:cell division protein ZapE
MTAPDAGGAPSGREPMALYRALRRQGRLEFDPAQQLAVEQLQCLYRALLDYHADHGLRGWFARLGLGENQGAHAPVGLYLCGPVGRGKSLLMELFFATAPVARKRRVHFHAFMLEIHDRIEQERRDRTAEPIAKVAADIANEAMLLCFDEFHVDNIADAMILGRLFTALFDAGIVVVATSNHAPDELYEHGLHRDRFLPFIELLKHKLHVLELGNGRDYRLARLVGKRVYYTPLDEAAHRALIATFAELTDGATGERASLMVKRRILTVPRAARNVAWFGFGDLCARPLAAADYLALAERYAAIIVEGIPRLAPAQRNEARRFNILIDTLYEARTLLVASAEVAPAEIYTAGDGSFEFRRTVSRLIEMQSADYLARRPPRC